MGDERERCALRRRLRRVLVASKQKAALQEHAKALALRTVGLERVGVDAD